MKRLAIMLLLNFIVYSSFCQARQRTMESFYDFTLNGTANFNGQVIMDSQFIINARLKVLRDKRFSLLFLEELSITNKSLRGSGGNEEKSDTLLFDMDNLVAYSFTEKKSYKYLQRNLIFSPPNNDQVAYKKNDTLFIGKKSIDSLSNPSPMVRGLLYGISTYSTRKFSFTYTSASEVEVSLLQLFKKVEAYPLSKEPVPFGF